MTILGHDLQNNEEITLPPDTLHTYILGNTGAGKTTLERALIAGNSQHGLCVIDPHGERRDCLINGVLSDLPSYRLRDVILFDINEPDYVPGLKPFYCRDKDNPIAVQDTISTALNMFEKVYNVDRTTMARIIAYIESLIYLFIYDDSLTLLDVPTLLNPDSKYDKKRVQACLHLPPSPGFDFTRDFWTEEYSRRAKRGYNQDSEIFGTLMKFRELSSHLLWPMFCQKTNTLDFREIMAQKKILLVKLNGNWEDITSLLGSYLIGQIKDAAMNRSLSDPPFYLYVDEFSTMASRDFLKLFSEGRGGNIHISIDHQVISQLDEDMKETIRQADCFVCFKVTDITAESVNTVFDTTPPPGEWIYEKQMRRVDHVVEKMAWIPAESEGQWNHLQQVIEKKEKARRKREITLPREQHHRNRWLSVKYGSIPQEWWWEVVKDDKQLQMEEEIKHLNQQSVALRNHYQQITETVYGDWYEPIPVVEEEYRSRMQLLNNNVKYTRRMGPSPYTSEEVARRTANQIKQLFPYQARVRLPSGEYTIQTIPPNPLRSIRRRIEYIYEQNLKDGYLRKRAEIEAEFQGTQIRVPSTNGHIVAAPPLPLKVK